MNAPTWIPGTAEFLPHVLLFEFLDSLPVQVQFYGNVFNRLSIASLANIEGKALGVERIIRKELQLLLLHLVAANTENPANLKFKVYTPIAAGKITHSPILAVIDGSVYFTAVTADGFFPCRVSFITMALESPKTPDTLCCGLKLQSFLNNRLFLYVFFQFVYVLRQLFVQMLFLACFCL